MAPPCNALLAAGRTAGQTFGQQYSSSALPTPTSDMSRFEHLFAFSSIPSPASGPVRCAHRGELLPTNPTNHRAHKNQDIPFDQVCRTAQANAQPGSQPTLSGHIRLAECCSGSLRFHKLSWSYCNRLPTASPIRSDALIAGCGNTITGGIEYATSLFEQPPSHAISDTPQSTPVHNY